MPGRCELLADDLGDNPCRGPDTDRGHRRQDRLKRVGLHKLLDPDQYLGPRAAQLGSDVGLVESGVYVARATASIIMVSNSIGVSFPKPRWRRLR